MRDFAAVAAAALGHAETLLARWLPDGKRRGHEWTARNPRRTDNTPGSFSVNVVTGAWADFATDAAGGDLISLRAYLDGSTQLEAMRAVVSDLGYSHHHPEKAPVRARSHPQAPEGQPDRKDAPPPETIRHPRLGIPSASWAYHDEAGQIVGYAVRFDHPDGGKDVLPYSWDGAAWGWKAMSAPRPIFGLPEIGNRSDAVVIVCEGEKAAQAASLLLPEAVCTTWSGGCQAWGKTDFRPLEGRKVILWPDADTPGMEAMRAIRAHLLAEIRAAAARLIDLPPHLPRGYDAADALADGWGARGTLDFLTGRAVPDGLCPACWYGHVAAPLGSLTCPHSPRKAITPTPKLPPFMGSADEWEQAQRQGHDL